MVVFTNAPLNVSLLAIHSSLIKKKFVRNFLNASPYYNRGTYNDLSFKKSTTAT